MSVDESTVREMAALARLSVPDERLTEVATEMDALLTFMGQIADFEGIENRDPPPTLRRPDRSETTHEQSGFQPHHTDKSGAVVVPPIKGAS